MTLAVALRVPKRSGWFTVTGFALAAIWTTGAFASGPVVFRASLLARRRHALGRGVLLGVAAFVAFVAVSRIATHIPLLAPALRGVLSKADTGLPLLVLIVALVNGVAEELFFRGAFYAALKPHRAVAVSTTTYVLVTVASGNVALVAAALVMGALLGVERRATGGVRSCVITHVVWSVLMLLAFPR